VRSIEVVLRVDILAERELRARADVVVARGIPLMPLRCREPGQQLADLCCKRRRVDRFGEDAQPSAVRRLLRRQRTADGAEERGPWTNLADVGEGLRPIRVVQSE